MKKLLCIVVACFMLLPLAACRGGKPAEPEHSAEPSAEHAPDHSFNKETDFNKKLATNGNTSTLLETDDVYYWLPDYDGFLRYVEKNGTDFGVVCGRPECEHDRGNSCIGDVNCDGHICAQQFIWSAEGKIWYLNLELWKEYPEACGVIFRMDPDGTNKELVKPIPKPRSEYGDRYSTVQYVCYHRGILFLFTDANFIDDAEPSSPFLIYTFTLDSEEPELIYDSGKDYHYGSIFPSGEFCYIQDFVWNEAGEYKDIISRWSCVTGETEVLYEGSDFCRIARYWVDDEGNIYTQEKWTEENGSKNVMRLENGVWVKAFDFEDPDISYTVRNVSDGVAIARNLVPFNAEGMDPDIDIWVKRYDGSTVYKGKLPMDWFEGFREQGMTLEGAFLVCGDENELFCEFGLRKRNETGSNEPESRVLVKYVMTGEGVEEVFLAQVYWEIVKTDN